ncbi:hypothetical protein C0Q70_17409 [Pomacea canaliculata]|uniref:Glutathione transferase n=1 Tax=Pomacea canaliculata TaxID=400727 RepID=A0A2T7NKA8_POMCA|nr:glutathione S-transferase 1-like [Pomacea canaliculata]PVD21610.1 hypothetical protein C0Q70_17409 [Pomacea canaliculata]
MAAVKLFYFDGAGRGEIIRLVLSAAGVEFDDVRFKLEDWPKYKPEAPFGQSPFIDYNGKKYAQSVAIANFFARENGLYGASNLEAFRIDEVVGLVQDLFTCMIPFFYEKDPAKKEELRAAMVKNDAPRFFGFFQKLLQENGTGYLVGNKLSLGDLIIYDIATQIRKSLEYDAAADFPEIKTLVDNVEGNENIKAYIDSRK